MNNKENFLEAAQWALDQESHNNDSGINIRRMPIMNPMGDWYYGEVILFNNSKGLLYEGYSNSAQAILKGLIVETTWYDGPIACDVISACFPKFYNLNEPNEKEQYKEYLDKATIHCINLME